MSDPTKTDAQADRWEAIVRIGKQPQPTDVFLDRFARAAAAAGVFEMKVRLFADNTAELRRYIGTDLDPLVDRIIGHLGSGLTEDEVTHLKKAVRVRNKLFHADFSKAAGTLLSMDARLDRGKVYIVDFSDGNPRKVSDLNTADGRISGWLMEGAKSGAFDQAFVLFMRCVALIQWLLAKASGEVES
jgi:hypothetical protein